MEPQKECMVGDLDSDEDPNCRGPPDAEFAENGSSEGVPKSHPFHDWDEHSCGYYQGYKIVPWWRGGKQPNQGWRVKIATSGSGPEHHEWRPYQDLGVPEPERRRGEKDGGVNGPRSK